MLVETMLTYGCNGCGHKIVQPLGMKTIPNSNIQNYKVQYLPIVNIVVHHIMLPDLCTLAICIIVNLLTKY